MRALRQEQDQVMTTHHPNGIDPAELSDERLVHELETLHARRVETLRHGSDDALAASTRRTDALEAEYLRRHPQREVDPARLRPPS